MRNFASRFNRQMTVGFAGDLPPADPMAAGTTFSMALVRQDKPDLATRAIQLYFTSNVVGLTAGLQLWIHGAGTDWVAVGAALAAVNQRVVVQAAGIIEDALLFVQVTPSAPLGAAETIDLYIEESEGA